MVFSLPFPALTAINSELKALPTEQISLSPSSIPVAMAPQDLRGIPPIVLNTCPTASSECVGSDLKGQLLLTPPYLALS